MNAHSKTLLEVRDLRVRFETADGPVHAVNGLSFTLARDRCLGIIGESGAGKSSTALAIMRLHPSANCEVTGEIWFDGHELISAAPDQVRRLRGRHMAMIFQDSLSALHPSFTVGHQIAEAYRAHHDVTRRAARRQALDLLDRVGIPQAASRLHDYPHQLSGGMRQRALIALAISCRPSLLIADEATSALDVVVQAQILDLLRDLRAESQSAMIVITHDVGVAAELADDLLVLYAGRAAETGPAAQTIESPHHPYTRALLSSTPLSDQAFRRRLPTIPGSPPGSGSLPTGCAFHPRCAHSTDRGSLCATEQPRPVSSGLSRTVACHLAGETSSPTTPVASVVNDPGRLADGAAVSGSAAVGALMSVSALRKHFPVRRGVLRRRVGPVRAIDGLDFDVRRGETLAIVGESGSGKTTTGRVLTRLIEPTGGRIVFDNQDISHLSQRDLRPLRRDLQMIFQDPQSALNPRQTIGTSVGVPFHIHGVRPAGGVRHAVGELLELVGLNPAHINRYPHEFSAGQRQRVGIARALALRPKMIVADEPVSALDMSVRAQVLNLLTDLQSELGLTYVLIAHDLSMTHWMSDRIAVMYLGKIVELGSRADVFDRPRHPYTTALLSAVPGRGNRGIDQRKTLRMRCEPPDSAVPPPACRFHPRCWKAQAVCRTTEPPLTESTPGHRVACHFPENDAC